MKQSLLQRLAQARAEQMPVVLVTDLHSGQHTLVFEQGQHGDCGLWPEALERARTHLASDQTTLWEPDADTRLLFHPYLPPRRLILVGARPLVEALARLALTQAYRVSVIDPRRTWPAEPGLPGLTVIPLAPAEALAQEPPDQRSAVVVLTHDPELDDPTLVAALATPAFYVGALGSRKHHSARIARLARAGVADQDLTRLVGPIGLALGAVTVGEQALAILGEITAVLRGRRRVEEN